MHSIQEFCHRGFLEYENETSSQKLLAVRTCLGLWSPGTGDALPYRNKVWALCKYLVEQLNTSLEYERQWTNRADLNVQIIKKVGVGGWGRGGKDKNCGICQHNRKCCDFQSHWGLPVNVMKPPVSEPIGPFTEQPKVTKAYFYFSQVQVTPTPLCL